MKIFIDAVNTITTSLVTEDGRQSSVGPFSIDDTIALEVEVLRQIEPVSTIHVGIGSIGKQPVVYTPLTLTETFELINGVETLTSRKWAGELNFSTAELRLALGTRSSIELQFEVKVNGDVYSRSPVTVGNVVIPDLVVSPVGLPRAATQADLEAETARASMEEAEISGNVATLHNEITAEISRAMSAEHVINESISTISESLNELPTIIDDLASEVSRATSAEASLEFELSGKADAAHEHPISDVTGLQSALDAKSAAIASEASRAVLAEAGKANTNHTHDASNITSGVFDIQRIPQGALERLVVVANQTERYALTNEIVQNGDVVKQQDTGSLYFVKDDTHLDGASGYENFSTGTASAVDWSGITNKPSTFTPAEHNHAISDVTGLQTALDDKATANSVSSETSRATEVEATLSAAISAETSRATQAEAGKANTAHSHSISDVSGLQTALDGKASSTHTHAITDVTGLNTIFVQPTDNPQVVFDNATAGSVLSFVPGVHAHDINGNGKTQNAILYVDKPMFIELQAGATLKLNAGQGVLSNTGEVTDNQGVLKTLNDFSIGDTSNYTGGVKKDYYIQIDGVGSPNTFKWGVFDGSNQTPIATGVAITGNEQTLQNGVKIKFGATTGHSIDSLWYVSYDGNETYGIRVGRGTHTDYIEGVKIYGMGTIDMNISGNVQPSLLVSNISSAVLVHGRVRRCSVEDISMVNCHRSFMAYGEHSGTYHFGGAVSGGESFNAEYIDCLNTKTINTDANGYGILLGHPSHRGSLKFVRCNGNYVKSLNTCLEPNYLLREYEVSNNVIDTATATYPLHLWRRSDNGVVANNKLIGDTTGAISFITTGAPGGWDTAKNITQYNNYNVNFGKSEPFPPTVYTSVDFGTDNMLAYYPLSTNSNEYLGLTSGINGVDTDITYSNSAANFNNSTSIITVPDNSIFSFNGTSSDKPFTISTKVKFTDTSSGMFVSKYSDVGTNREFLFGYFSGNLQLALYTDAANFISVFYAWTPVVGTEYNIVVTYSGNRSSSGIKLYVDGVAVTTTSNNGGTYTGMPNGTAPLVFGKTGWTNAHQLGGSMKSVRIYGEAKSATGVAAIKTLP